MSPKNSPSPMLCIYGKNTTMLHSVTLLQVVTISRQGSRLKVKKLMKSRGMKGEGDGGHTLSPPQGVASVVVMPTHRLSETKGYSTLRHNK
jgi:hypothetical protein